MGGWLILVILSLFVAAFYQAYGIYEIITEFVDGTVKLLTDPLLWQDNQSYIVGYSGALKFELISGILLLGATFYLIYLFTQKSSKFPKYYPMYLAVGAIYGILDYFIFSLLSSSHEEGQTIIREALSNGASQIFKAVIAALIWGSYMKNSKRVKLTFIEK